MSQKIFLQKLFDARSRERQTFPDKGNTEEFIDKLFNLLFVPGTGKQKQFPEFEKEFESLKSHLSTLLYDVVKDGNKTQEITDNFFDDLPDIYSLLLKDAKAISQFDPAAESIEEVIIAYPGFFATVVYRFSNQLWRQQVKILPRLFTEYAHSKTGIDIHPGASIGESFFIDHGTGIVIGESTVIGNNVKIYQGVTLGALHVGKDQAKVKRHPTIEDNVTIYSGATILGGDTVIGHDSLIGGNVWLTYSIPSFSVVYHKSEVKVRDNNPFPEPVNFVI